MTSARLALSPGFTSMTSHICRHPNATFPPAFMYGLKLNAKKHFVIIFFYLVLKSVRSAEATTTTWAASIHALQITSQNTETNGGRFGARKQHLSSSTYTVSLGEKATSNRAESQPTDSSGGDRTRRRRELAINSCLDEEESEEGRLKRGEERSASVCHRGCCCRLRRESKPSERATETFNQREELYSSWFLSIFFYHTVNKQPLSCFMFMIYIILL